MMVIRQNFFNPWKIFVRKGLPLRRTILLFFCVFFKCRRNDTSQCKIMRGKNYLSYLRKWKICLRQFLEFFTMRFNFKVKYCLDFRERNCMQLSSLILCPFVRSNSQEEMSSNRRLLSSGMARELTYLIFNSRR